MVSSPQCHTTQRVRSQSSALRLSLIDWGVGYIASLGVNKRGKSFVGKFVSSQSDIISVESIP